LGTGAAILVLLQLVGLPAVPLNVTVLVPCVAPKFVPVTVTAVLMGPNVGLRLEMLGVGITVKATPLLAEPTTVTTTFPVVAPAGTATLMLIAFQLDGVAKIPLNITVLVPWLDPKLDPEIVTNVPTGPDVGLRLLMWGFASATPTSPATSTKTRRATSRATPTWSVEVLMSRKLVTMGSPAGCAQAHTLADR